MKFRIMIQVVIKTFGQSTDKKIEENLNNRSVSSPATGWQHLHSLQQQKLYFFWLHT